MMEPDEIIRQRYKEQREHQRLSMLIKACKDMIEREYRAAGYHPRVYIDLKFDENDDNPGDCDLI